MQSSAVELRMLVISDPHAHNLDVEDPQAPSYFSTMPQYANDPRINPLLSIPKVLEDAALVPDLLLCPGDLADKNDGPAQQMLWSQLDDLKTKIKAKRLIATVGNHDLDSRRLFSDQLPDTSLKSLVPQFPISGKANAAKFWSDGFLIYPLINFDATIVILNSCLLHGLTSPDAIEKEYLRGSVPSNVLAKLQNGLSTTTNKNVLMLHHHVRKHPWVHQDASFLKNGETLVAMLEATEVPWLILHGHFHTPWLTYASSAMNAPTVFSAGSVSARTFPVMGQHPRNQMYFISLGRDHQQSCGIQGTVRSWDWTPHLGWELAKSASGLPWRTGFGTKGGIPELVSKIDTELGTRNGKQADWNGLVATIPPLGYLTPSDTMQTVKELTHRGIKVHFDVLGVPEYLRKI